MGYMRHHAILVTSWDGERLATAHRRAKACGLPVSEIVGPLTNGNETFCVAPDGSKEGWPESDRGDSQRGEFLTWLDRQRYGDGSSPLDWVEVQYGDDDRVTLILRHSDETMSGDDYSGPCALEREP